MSEIETAVLNALQRVKTRESGDGSLVTLPLALSTGNLIQVYVERVGDGSWFITDQGVVAAELAMAGVNLQSKSAGSNWARVRRAMKVDAPLFRADVRTFDLAGLADSETLGRAVLEVGEAMIRGEALRVTAPGYRGRRFRDTIVQAATKRDLDYIVNADLPTKHNGHRKVSVKVWGNNETYIQAISTANTPQETFDLAQSILTSSNVGSENLAIVLQRGVTLESWQRKTLEDHGTPVEEDALDAFMERIAS